MSAADWPIVREIAIVFGFIMRGIYLFFSSFGIYSIPICVITFTVISKLLIIPSTYKKQKLSLLSPKLLPSFEKVGKKYENKLEHPLANNKINIDKGFIFKRYGLSTGSGIAMTFVQLPVLFALYAIIQDMPRFVPELSSLNAEQTAKAFSFFGLHINEAPGFVFNATLLFPIFTALLQLVEMIQNSMMNKTLNNGKLAGGMMNAISTGMMFWFATTLPVICSVYWISNTIINILITFGTSLYVKNKDLSYFANKEIVKINKSRKKRNLKLLTSI